MPLLRCALFVLSAALTVSVSYQDEIISTRLDFCPVPCGLPTISLGGNEYYIQTSSKVTWFEAFEICRVNQMKLLSIETVEENNLIKRAIATTALDMQFWTSGNDLENEGTFIWRSTGHRVTFSDWETREPGNHANVEHCVFIGNWGQKTIPMWHDITCMKKMFFICEKPVNRD